MIFSALYYNNTQFLKHSIFKMSQINIESMINQNLQNFDLENQGLSRPSLLRETREDYLSSVESFDTEEGVVPKTCEERESSKTCAEVKTPTSLIGEKEEKFIDRCVDEKVSFLREKLPLCSESFIEELFADEFAVFREQIKEALTEWLTYSNKLSDLQAKERSNAISEEEMKRLKQLERVYTNYRFNLFTIGNLLHGYSE